ncbi:hypothetical protein AAVH_27916 [Aphelenchoides avenae]|nr:hypothetical protein AAVH_27916 [Aphelenchus avenae]
MWGRYDARSSEHDSTCRHVCIDFCPTTSLASTTPGPCDCINVIRGVCPAVDNADKCIAACQGLGLGAGVCVDLVGIDLEAGLCVCIGPFRPGSGGGNGCEAAPSTSVAPSSTPGPCDCINVIRGVCQPVVGAQQCIAACEGLGLGAGVCADIGAIDLEAGLCVCIGPFRPGSGGGNGCEANTTPALPSTTPIVTSTNAATTHSEVPSTSIASSTPAPCDCVNVIDDVCQAVGDTEKCIAACEGVGLGVGVCLDLPDIAGLDAAICVCTGPFQAGSGGNGCEAATTPGLPTTTQMATTSVASSSTPAPCDCVNVIRGVCRAVDDTEECTAACQGQGLGAGFCVGVLGVNAEAALCVCIGPFRPGSGGSNGCGADTTPALPSTTPRAATSASTSVSPTNGPTTSLASTTPGPCDCINVIRGVCPAVDNADKCIAACQGLGLGAGVCVDLGGIDLEAGLCVCIGPFRPGSGGGNGCEAALTASIASSSPAPCDCINVIRGVCRAVVDTENCISACHGLGLGAGVCVDLFGVGVEAALCVCTGPFRPGSGGGNGCEAGTTLSLPSTTPSIAPSEPTTASASTSTSAVSTSAPGQCIRSIDDICKDPVSVVENAICDQHCKDLLLGFRGGICIGLPDKVHIGVALCICL